MAERPLYIHDFTAFLVEKLNDYINVYANISRTRKPIFTRYSALRFSLTGVYSKLLNGVVSTTFSRYRYYNCLHNNVTVSEKRDLSMQIELKAIITGIHPPKLYMHKDSKVI